MCCNQLVLLLDRGLLLALRSSCLHRAARLNGLLGAGSLDPGFRGSETIDFIWEICERDQRFEIEIFNPSLGGQQRGRHTYAHCVLACSCV